MVVLDHGAVGIRWFMARRELHGCPNVAVKLVVRAMGIPALMLAYKIWMVDRSAMQLPFGLEGFGVLTSAVD